MAEMHTKMGEMHHGGMIGSGGEMYGEMMGSGGMHGGMPMVPSRATVEDIPGGARLVIAPDDPAQVAALRDHARPHVAMMQKGECR
jgi:hypothetical protein